MKVKIPAGEKILEVEQVCGVGGGWKQMLEGVQRPCPVMHKTSSYEQLHTMNIFLLTPWTCSYLPAGKRMQDLEYNMFSVGEQAGVSRTSECFRIK